MGSRYLNGEIVHSPLRRIPRGPAFFLVLFCWLGETEADAAKGGDRILSEVLTEFFA